MLMAAILQRHHVPGNAAIAGNHAAVVYQAVPVAGAGGRNMVSRAGPQPTAGVRRGTAGGPVGNVVPALTARWPWAADGITSVVWSQQGFVGGSLVRDRSLRRGVARRAFGAFERISPEGGYAICADRYRCARQPSGRVVEGT